MDDVMQKVGLAMDVAHRMLPVAAASLGESMYVYADGECLIAADPAPLSTRGWYALSARLTETSIASEEALVHELLAGTGCVACMLFEFRRREDAVKGVRRERRSRDADPVAVALRITTTCEIRHALEEVAIPVRTAARFNGRIDVSVFDYGAQPGKEPVLTFNVSSASGKLLRSFTNAYSNERAMAECCIYVLGFLECDMLAADEVAAAQPR